MMHRSLLQVAYLQKKKRYLGGIRIYRIARIQVTWFLIRAIRKIRIQKAFFLLLGKSYDEIM
jgi:hypothetical protein